MVRNNLIHLSKSTVRGSSYNASWQIPLIEGDYSWCPNDSDERPYLDEDLGKFYIDKESRYQNERITKMTFLLSVQETQAWFSCVKLAQ